MALTKSPMDYGRLGLPEPPNPPSEPPPPTTSRLKIVLFFSFVLLLASAVSVALVLHLRARGLGSGSGSGSFSHPQPTQAISRTCSRTYYQSLCISSLLEFPGSLAATEKDLVHISVNVTLQRVGKALFAYSDIGNREMETRVRSAFEDCMELLEDSVDHLSRSLSSVAPKDGDGGGGGGGEDGDGDGERTASVEDVVTWLSAALTNQDTCTEGLSEAESGEVKDLMKEKLKDLAELVSNSLAIYSSASDDPDFAGVPIQDRRRRLLSEDSTDSSPEFQQRRLITEDSRELSVNRRRRLMLKESDETYPEFRRSRLMSVDSGGSSPDIQRKMLMTENSGGLSVNRQRRLMTEDAGELSPEISRRRSVIENSGESLPEFPVWLSRKERALMELPAAKIQADIVVSRDGNGTYKTIKEAIKKAPEHSNRRFIIYVRAGRYEEKELKVGRQKKNLMFIGDGKGKTVITGGVSVANKVTTFHTASFAATGAGFIARDITFENYAGPIKHQAVALRVSADHSVVYRCSIIGFQDSLYVHSQRQFFRECDIYGTVDFIFGNAAVVFQNCSMYARKPMDLQKVTITAQNRKDPNQNTGISIHACRLLAQPDLQATHGSVQTFLGRPWKMYSRTVYMLTFMGGHIDPKGWLEWNETFALDTLYYGEYMNYGPGGAIGQRVKWPGYRVITSSVEASQFTVAKFIYGSSWLPSTGVAFLAGLSD